MLEGLYSAAAGMEAQQTQLNAISGDVANVDTPGYQAELVGFQDLLYGTDNDDPSTALVGAGAAAQTYSYSDTEGEIEQTGNPLDVAIDGDAYLQVRQSDGTVGLTRNGTLQLSGSGQLTTSLGMPVEPPITVPRGTDAADIKIASNGTVSAGGRTLGRLALVNVTAPDKLVPNGNSVFSVTAASGPVKTVAGATVEQGALEQSNVDLSDEMSQMMQTEQSYEMSSKAIQLEAQMGQIASSLK